MPREPEPQWEADWMRVLVARRKHVRIVGQGPVTVADLQKLVMLIEAQIAVMKEDEETPDAG